MVSSTTTTIACIGGIDVDRKARVIGALHPGTSNPVRVSSCSGGVVGNVARNLALLGSRVALFSIVGSDPSGDRLLHELASAAIDVSAMRRSSARPTATYTAVLDHDGQLFIGLADMEIFEELDPAWADSIAPRLAQCPVWIVDANLPADTIDRLLQDHRGGAKVLADPISVAKCLRFRNSLSSIDVFFPNRLEAAELTGLTVGSPDNVARAAAQLRRLGVGTVVLTLGAEGIYLAGPRSSKSLPAVPPAKIVDVTGAGDALVAGYAYAMLYAQKDDPALFGLAAASFALETEHSVADGLTPGLLRRRIESSRPRKARS